MSDDSKPRYLFIPAGVALVAMAAGLALGFDEVVTRVGTIGGLADHANVITVSTIWVLAVVGGLMVAFAVRGALARDRSRTRTQRALRASRVSLATLVAFLVALRVGAPYLIEAVFDDALGALPEHWGSVQDVDLALYRGRYTIIELNVLERNAGIDRPVIALERTDIELDWKRLLDGEIDAVVALTGPRFSIVKNERAVQTGDSPALRDQLLAFVPLDISRFTIDGGRFRFIDETSTPRVDVDLRDIHVEAHGLSTRPSTRKRDEPGALPAHIEATASVLGEAPLRAELDLDAFADQPTFDFSLEMEKLPLTALNEVTQAYAKFDYEAGTLAFYAELASADGAIEGYAKPIIANSDVLDTDKNDANDGILELTWNAFVGAMSTIFEDHGTDTVATRIPLEGRFDRPDVGIFETVFNLLGHAFVNTISARVDGSISIEDVLAHVDKERT